MKNVTVIGLGVMGAALARGLLEQGFNVTVWNRTRAKARPLLDLGGKAPADLREAVEASETVVCCVSSHRTTRRLLETVGEALSKKQLIELSSGDPSEAQSLSRYVESCGGRCLVGMILSFPGGIGGDRTSICTAGDSAVWEGNQDVLASLAGKTSYLGEDPEALATIFAALFLPRQGYMFGMIYGALLCEKSGVALEAYLELLPQLAPLLNDYLEVVRNSIPGGDFSNPPASLNTIGAAYHDALAPFRALDVSRELPELMARIVDASIEAGHGAEQMTAIIKTLR